MFEFFLGFLRVQGFEKEVHQDFHPFLIDGIKHVPARIIARGECFDPNSWKMASKIVTKDSFIPGCAPIPLTHP